MWTQGVADETVNESLGNCCIMQVGGTLRGRAHLGLLLAAARHAVAWPLHLDVEVHAKDTCGGVVLDTQVDVLADAKAKVPCGHVCPVSHTPVQLPTLAA